MKSFKRNIDIILIVLVGFILRFSISTIHSYSNDELSAVSRLRFENFSDLIEFGVMKGDMHPAGVQVFMKLWSSIGGTSESWMRLPFVLFGTASIFFLFLIGKNWFNRKVGLIAASLLAVLYFPIMHAEFARPYSPGLLLTLLVGLYVGKVLFEDKERNKNTLILGVLFALAMYTHYFAFLTVGLMGVSGVFFLSKENWKNYVASGLIGIVLFLPHLNVTLYHLAVESTDWISAPPNDWLFQFLFFAFNSSWFVVFLLLILVGVAVFKKSTNQFKTKKVVLLCSWFFGIYAIGHLISFYTPILKFPVALFILPFLLLVIGIVLSRIPKTLFVVSLIGSVGVLSTVLERNLYGNQHYAVFKEVSDTIIDWEKEYGEENIYSIFNLNNVSYLNYYANQIGDTIKLDQNLVTYGGDAQIRLDLIETKDEYCIVGYAARTTLMQTFETVKEFFPVLVDFQQYKNGAIYLFKKGDVGAREKGTLLAEFGSGNNDDWLFDPERLSQKGYLLDMENPYGPDFSFKKGEIEDIENAYIKIEVEAEMDSLGQLTAAISGNRNGKAITNRGETFWLGKDLEEMLTTSKESIGYFAFNIPTYILSDDALKISLWNRSGVKIYVKSIRIYLLDNKWN